MRSNPKLLRAIQEREIVPVGARSSAPIDVRIIAASNQALEQHAVDGTFRADLYHRLAELQVVVPPLRARRPDLPALVTQLVRDHARRAHKRIAGVSAEALSAIAAHAWPGNVRQLAAALRRAVARCADGEGITSAHLDLPPDTPPPPPAEAMEDAPLPEQLAALERHAITRAMAAAKGNQTRAAARLGISRQGLINKLERLGLKT